MEELHDDAGAADVHVALAMVANWQLRWAEVAGHTYAAAGCFRAAGDRHREFDILNTWLVASLWGPDHRDEVERRVDEFVRRTSGAGPAARAWVAHAQGHLAEMRDDLRQARRLHEECMEFVRATGDAPTIALLEGCLGQIEMADGHWAEAEHRFRRVLEPMMGMGDLAHASTAAAWLARALARQGRGDAVHWAEEAERMAAPEDVATMMLARQARALAACAAGDIESAERLARAAVAMADQTDGPAERGDASMDLAEILASSGRIDEASDALRKAIGLYEQKGDEGRRRRAAMRLASLGAVGSRGTIETSGD
jgi:tetratricopeptide (TPR) repeat protein